MSQRYARAIFFVSKHKISLIRSLANVSTLVNKRMACVLPSVRPSLILRKNLRMRIFWVLVFLLRKRLTQTLRETLSERQRNVHASAWLASGPGTGF